MIPATWGEVTCEWMTEVLQERFPGVIVATTSPLWISDGNNRRARFALTYAVGQGPEVVFVKAEGEHRHLHAENGNLFIEAELYGSSLPLPLDHPDTYAILVDRPRLDWMIVMEDVARRGGDPRDSTRPITPLQARNGVRGLARLHREYWGLDVAARPELSWLQTWGPTDGFEVGLRKYTPNGLERLGAALPAELAGLTGDDVVDLWVRYAALIDRDPVTLLHADAHIGNTYLLPGDQVGFLDWQVTRRGNWSQDVGHFLPGALIEVDCRAHERAIIEAYCAELDRGLSVAEAWTWYRASALHGLTFWLSTLGSDGYQTHEISYALASRFAAATVALDSRQALEELEAADAR